MDRKQLDAMDAFRYCMQDNINCNSAVNVIKKQQEEEIAQIKVLALDDALKYDLTKLTVRELYTIKSLLKAGYSMEQAHLNRRVSNYELDLMLYKVTQEQEGLVNMINRSNRERHTEVCEDLNELYFEKNTRYGNSFSELYQEMGMDYVVPRLYEKVKRLMVLTREDLDSLDESIEDSLMDLANYSIMTLMELRGRV